MQIVIVLVVHNHIIVSSNKSTLHHSLLTSIAALKELQLEVLVSISIVQKEYFLVFLELIVAPFDGKAIDGDPSKIA